VLTMEADMGGCRVMGGRHENSSPAIDPPSSSRTVPPFSSASAGPV